MNKYSIMVGKPVTKNLWKRIGSFQNRFDRNRTVMMASTLADVNSTKITRQPPTINQPPNNRLLTVRKALNKTAEVLRDPDIDKY